MPDWTDGETRRQADWRDEYQRPHGKHRAQAPKPAQAGPSLPPAPPLTDDCDEGLHGECRRITDAGDECACGCHEDDDEVSL